MFRTLNRRRALVAGLAVTLGVVTLGLGYNPAQAGPPGAGFGKDRVARAKRLGAELEAFTKAAKTCDLDTTREAFEALESVWNAVEIDIQFSSVERYNFFEHVYLEDRVARGTGLEGDPVESCENMVSFAKAQETTWAEVISFLKHSPENSPLFNDVATLRTINQGLRLARAAIDGYPEAVPQSPMTEPDPSAAKAHWDQFVADYPTARALLAFRRPSLATEVDGLVATVTAAFAPADAPDYPEASAALAALAPRYNLGATLVTAAARGHVPVRSVFDSNAPYTVGTVGDILAGLEGMRDQVRLGTGAGATKAQEIYTEAVQESLSFKTGGPLTHADVALTTAMENYVADRSSANARALLDQIAVAEQLFAGQYWRTKPLADFLNTL